MEGMASRRSPALSVIALTLFAAALPAQTRSYMGAGKARIELAPEGTDRAWLESELRRLSPAICVESLNAIPMPDGFPDLPRTQRFLAYGNALRAISTLKGIEYFSVSKGKRRVLYLESHLVASADGEEPLPDPRLLSLPARETAYARQSDASFGENVMELEYRYSEGSLALSAENLRPMKVGPIQAVKPRQSKTIVCVREEGGLILFYALSMANAVAIPGLGDKIRDSAVNRTAALLEWFTRGLSSRPAAQR
jgi:hypothetical protein